MKKIEDKFVPYDLSLRLKNLGFDEPCFATYFTIGAWQIDCTEGALNLNNNKPTEYSILAPLWQDAFDWLDEKFNMYPLIYTIYPTKDNPNKFYTYGITTLNDELLVDANEIFGDLLEQCYQNIQGNYVNQEKLNDLIFTSGFGFKEKTKAKQACLEKLIEIVEQIKTP
jgi:hypothetical protein